MARMAEDKIKIFSLDLLGQVAEHLMEIGEEKKKE